MCVLAISYLCLIQRVGARLAKYIKTDPSQTISCNTLYYLQVILLSLICLHQKNTLNQGRGLCSWAFIP